MNLTIDTQSYKEVLLENNELFKTFLYEYYNLKDICNNEKYKLNKVVLQLYDNLEEKHIHVFNEYQNKDNFKKKRILKKQNYTHYKLFLQEKVLEKLKINKNYSLRPVTFNKIKIKKISNHCLVKSYSFFNDNKDNYAYFVILNEIILHYYGYLLTFIYQSNNVYQFKIPKLYQITKKTIKNGNTKISIFMEYIEYIDKKNIVNIYDYQEHIQNILLFLEKNYLYHNDTHKENILLQKDGIVLIDFGQASLFEESGLSDYSFKYESNKNIFDNWLKKRKTTFY